MPLTGEERQALLEVKQLLDGLRDPSFVGETAAHAVSKGAATFLPTLGAMGASMAVPGLLSLVAPEAELPLLAEKGLQAVAGGLGGMAGEATRTRLAGDPQDATRLMRTGAEFAAFPMLFEGAGVLPGLRGQGLLREGTVLGSTARGALAGGTLGAGEAAISGGGLADVRRQTMPAALAGGAASGIAQGLVNLPGRMSGRTLQEARRRIEDFSDELVQSTRRGGVLEPKIDDLLDRRGTLAWSKMRSLVDSITDPITAEEVSNSSIKLFGHDPEALQGVKEVLAKPKAAGMIGRVGGGTRMTGLTAEDLKKLSPSAEISVAGGSFQPASSLVSGESFTARELENLSSKLGEQIKQAAREGRAAPPGSDLKFIHARSVIADVLEEKAPEALKGSVRQAKQDWEDYIVGLRNPVKAFFHPGRSMHGDTEPGVQLFQRVAEGKETPFERRFLQGGVLQDGTVIPGLEKDLGVQIVEPLRKLGKGASREQVFHSVARLLGPTGLLAYLTRSAAFRMMRRSN